MYVFTTKIHPTNFTLKPEVSFTKWKERNCNGKLFMWYEKFRQLCHWI